MFQYKDIAEKLDEYIYENLEEIVAISDWIAEHPELGHQEYEASRVLCEALEKENFTVGRPYAEHATAFNAFFKNGEGDAPTIGFLAQYDALPEVGHGCGHNMCGPISVLAARALKHVLEEKNIPAKIRVIGTPAEETTGEKVPMAKAGLFDDCDLVLMAHPESGSSFIGINSLAVDPYEFTFIGKSAHAAASPWEGKNALNGLQLFLHAVDMLRQHIRPEARMHGIITEGGAAPNIVPSKAAARLLIRAPWRGYLDEIVEKVFDCARGAAMATQTEVSWSKCGYSMDNVLPNPTGKRMLKEIMEKEVGEPINDHPSLTGSTDMGAISWRVPTLELLICVSEQEIAPHTADFAQACRGDRAKSALCKAARGLARAGLKTILDETLRKKMKEDLEEQKRLQLQEFNK